MALQLSDPNKEFLNLMECLLDMDDTKRKAAEEQFKKIPGVEAIKNLIYVIACGSSLSAAGDASVSLPLKTLSLVLLRQKCVVTTFGDIYPDCINTQDQDVELLKRVLLELAMAEEKLPVKRNIGDCIAELSRNFKNDADEQTWGDALKLLFICGNNQSTANQKVLALHIIRRSPQIFGRKKQEYMSVINSLYENCLLDSEITVRREAVQSIAAFLQDNADEEETTKAMKGIIVPFLQAISGQTPNSSCDNFEPDDEMLESLVQLCEYCPKMLRQHTNSVVQFCLMMVKPPEDVQEVDADDLDTSTRRLAVEAILSLAESASAMFRKNAAAFCPVIVCRLIDMMETIPCSDEQKERKWVLAEHASSLAVGGTAMTNGVGDDEGDDADNDVEEPIHVFGETSLDRLCIALQGKVLIDGLLERCTENLRKTQGFPDQRYRIAGLMALSTAGEGCRAQYITRLEKIVPGVLHFLSNDPCPRVRYAACNTIGQMCADFAPRLQRQYGGKILPALCDRLRQEREFPRVQAHAAAAIINYCADLNEQSAAVKQAAFTPYCKSVVETCAAALEDRVTNAAQPGARFVIEQLVTTVAALADVLGKDFVEYYPRFLPLLKTILSAASEQIEASNAANRPKRAAHFHLLRGKAFECVSLIGDTVGKEQFLKDFQDVTQMLHQIQEKLSVDQDSLPADDPELEYIQTAWLRICKLIGPEFAPYLSIVLPSVLKVASRSPELQIKGPDETDIEGGEWQCVNIGDQQSLAIKTTGLEQKASAHEHLQAYVEALGAAFAPHALQTLDVVVNDLKFVFEEAVRSSTAQTVPLLLDSLVKAGEITKARNCFAVSSGDASSASIRQVFISAMTIETEPSVLADQLIGYADCLKVLNGIQPNTAVDEPLAPNVDIDKVLATEDAPAVESIVKIVTKTLNDVTKRQRERVHQRTAGLRGDATADYDEEVEEELKQLDENDNTCLSACNEVTHLIFKHVRPRTAVLQLMTLDCDIEYENGDNVSSLHTSLWRQVLDALEPMQATKCRQWAICIVDDAFEHGGDEAATQLLTDDVLEKVLAYLVDDDWEVRQAAAFGVGVAAQMNNGQSTAGQRFTAFLLRAIDQIIAMAAIPNSREDECVTAVENGISALMKILRHRPDIVADPDAKTRLLTQWFHLLPIWEDYEELEGVYDFFADLVIANDPVMMSDLPHLMRILSTALQRATFVDTSVARQKIIAIIDQLRMNGDLFNQLCSGLEPEQLEAVKSAISAIQR